MRKSLLIVSLVLFLFILINSVSAVDYYVAPNGDDATGDGTFANPYGTFSIPIANAGPGDVIYARGGTYDYSNAMDGIFGKRYIIHIDYSANQGTPSNWITIRNYPGELPVFDLSAVSYTHLRAHET